MLTQCRRRTPAQLQRLLLVHPPVARQRSLVAARQISRQRQMRLWMQQWELLPVMSGWLKRWRTQNLLVEGQHSPVMLLMQPAASAKRAKVKRLRRA